MFSTSTFRSQPVSRQQGRKPTLEGQGAAKKPKKVNSEIRKQQNRIASRNYREKRKRKLQYLQQLLKEGNSPEQAAQAVEQARGQRVLTPEYFAQSQTPTTISFSHSDGFSTLATTTGSTVDSILGTTSNSYDSHVVPTTQAFPPYEPSWSTSIYETPQPVNISAWNVPSWMPSIEFTPAMTSRPEDFPFTPPHTRHGFEQLPTPPLQPPTPDPDLFILGSYGACRKSEGPSLGISCVSLPSSASSSPYYHPRYPGVP